jgi:hypothetical protein
MIPEHDTPIDHCPELRDLWTDSCASAKPEIEALAQHSHEHGCSPRMTDFYVADLQLLSARTADAAGAALDRCEALAEQMPDLRFFVVEETLRLMIDAGPPTDPIVNLVRRRQTELRRRWSTLPCRGEGRPSTNLVNTD